MTEVKVYEVFRLCMPNNESALSGANKTHDSNSLGCRPADDAGSRRPAERNLAFNLMYAPCVTKLPKFRPTMQCQVGPFRSSNYCPEINQSGLDSFHVAGAMLGIEDLLTVRLMCCAMSCGKCQLGKHCQRSHDSRCSSGQTFSIVNLDMAS